MPRWPGCWHDKCTIIYAGVEQFAHGEEETNMDTPNKTAQPGQQNPKTQRPEQDEEAKKADQQKQQHGQNPMHKDDKGHEKHGQKQTDEGKSCGS